MHNYRSIRAFERRLVELGCPMRYTQRSVAEMAEHFEDLTQAKIDDGLEDADAHARASGELGEPTRLAERMVASFRESSWWGRHPVIGFCLLPPLTLLLLLPCSLAVLYGMFLLSNLLVLRPMPFDEFESAVKSVPAAFAEWNNALLLFIHCVPIAINTILFCKLVARSASGMNWLIVTCGVCSATGFFTWTGFSQSGFYLGYGSPSIHNWISAAVPLLIMIGIFAWKKRRLALIGVPDPESQALPDPDIDRCEAADKDGLKNVKRWRAPLKEQWFTPTSAIAAAILVGAILLIRFVFTHDKTDHVKMEALRNQVWPAERKSTLERLQIRQSVKETFGEIPIYLQPFATAALNEPVCWFGKTNFATLADLPRGLRIFAGVPFAISERVQLMGNGFKNLGMAFPTRVRGIPINQTCQHLYILHGASFVRTQVPAAPDENGFMPVLPMFVTSNLPIARLVLHYADGGSRELEIVSKQHLLDVWGPICHSEVPAAERCPESPDTELAWISSEVPSEKSEMLNSVRLYRTRFINPRPDAEILTMDYVSTRTDAAPFLLGITTE